MRVWSTAMLCSESNAADCIESGRTGTIRVQDWLSPESQIQQTEDGGREPTANDIILQEAPAPRDAWPNVNGASLRNRTGRPKIPEAERVRTARRRFGMSRSVTELRGEESNPYSRHQKPLSYR